MKQQIYNTALYMRLSRDDENYGDSVSIETQRTILQEYARNNNLHIVDEYIDIDQLEQGVLFYKQVISEAFDV